MSSRSELWPNFQAPKKSNQGLILKLRTLTLECRVHRFVVKFFKFKRFAPNLVCRGFWGSLIPIKKSDLRNWKLPSQYGERFFQIGLYVEFCKSVFVFSNHENPRIPSILNFKKFVHHIGAFWISQIRFCNRGKRPQPKNTQFQMVEFENFGPKVGFGTSIFDPPCYIFIQLQEF